MDAITIEAASRETGKQAARATRREGNVPCVLYGPHVDNVCFQVPELTIHRLVYTSETHLLNLKVGEQAWDCILKDVDFHPVTDRPIHADFQALQAGEKINLMIPVQYHGVPEGQTDGGDTQYLMHELEVRCLPSDIPSHIDVDVSHLKIGDAIHIEDLEIEGIEFEDAPERTLVTVVPPRMLELPEEEEEGIVSAVEVPLVDEDEEAAEGEEEEEE